MVAPPPSLLSGVQLLQHLQRLRSAAYAASSVSSGATGLVQGGSSHSADAAACVLEASAAAGGSNCHMSSEQLDIEAMACELLAMGYMVQVRDGQQQQDRSKTPRSCLQNLRHRFIVCLGTRSAVDGEPAYLPEPLVVEPRFREQFIIAHPTPEYEALLQVRCTRWRQHCQLKRSDMLWLFWLHIVWGN